MAATIFTRFESTQKGMCLSVGAGCDGTSVSMDYRSGWRGVLSRIVWEGHSANNILWFVPRQTVIMAPVLLVLP